MNLVETILLVVGLILFIVDGFKLWGNPRLNLTALGLACWTAVAVIGRF